MGSETVHKAGSHSVDTSKRASFRTGWAEQEWCMLHSVTHRGTASCSGVHISCLNPCWQGCNPYTNTTALHGRQQNKADAVASTTGNFGEYAQATSFEKGARYLGAGLACTNCEKTVPECTPAASAGALTLAAGTAVATGVAAEALTDDRMAGTAAVALAGSVGLAATTGAAVAADLGGAVALRGVAAAGFAAGPASRHWAQTQEAMLFFYSCSTK